MDEFEEFNLRPLHAELFKIYQEMDRVCMKYGLRLYGTSGTALGAVRHHGFIPWDDDMDVGMPRPDYERFLEIADRELPANLKLITWRNCKAYDLILSKVVLADRERVDHVAEESGLKLAEGIYIDIFPFDGFPTSPIAVKFRLVRMAVYKCVQHLGYRLRSSRLRRLGLALRERELRRIPFETAERVINNMWFREDLRFAKSPKSSWYSAKALGGGRLIPFENGTMRVFDDVDVYLRSIYGDYMKLPPLEQQRLKHGLDNIAVPSWRFGVRD